MRYLLTTLFLLLLSETALFSQTLQEKNELLKKESKTQVDEAIKKERQYAQEQKFYQGDEYDLEGAEVDEKSLKNVPILEPQYDFDMTDVYD